MRRMKAATRLKKTYIPKNVRKQPAACENQQIVMMLFFVFFIFTFIGAGSFIVVSLAGLLLCITGLLQSSVKVDLWILIPLILYNAISLLSGYTTYGNTLEGLASTQAVFPVLYLLAAYLDNRERALLKKLCAIWIGVMAAIGIGQFTIAAFFGSASRLSGLMGNPNAMGAMLALGWFALQSCLLEPRDENPLLKRLLQGLEFFALVALALTLSIGAYGVFSIGVIAMCIYGKEHFSDFVCRIARLVFAFGCGILLYIAGTSTDWPWLCLILCIYILIASVYQELLGQCLEEHKWISILMVIAGICGTGLLVYLRPNAAATFTERLAMIRNGLGYLWKHPLLGIGPYQWRGLNLQDGDIYFNTWHIHNIFIHVGVELGLAAMTMLIATAIRHFCKREDPAQRGASFAALSHNLMDTSFFYLATVPFLIMISAKDERKTRLLSGTVVKCIFGAFALLFAWNTIQCLL